MTTTISTLSAFDDIRRCFAVLNDGTAEEEFLRVLRLQEKFRQECLNIAQSKDRIQKELDNALKSLADYETKLFHARRLLEMEGKARRDAEFERDNMEKRITSILDILQNERNLKDETKNKIAVLNTLPRKRKSLNRQFEEKYGNEINSTGSFLSDLSITQSEDDFLDVHTSKEWVKHRPSLPKNQVPFVGGKRSRLSGGPSCMPIGAHSTPPPSHAGQSRRSNTRRSINTALHNINNNISHNNNNIGDGYDVHNYNIGHGMERISATTKVTIPQDGNGIIRAESTIETVPIVEHTRRPTNVNSNNKENEIKQEAPPSTPFKEATAPPMTPLKGMAPQPPIAARSTMLRQHNFVSKTGLRVDTCMQCQKKIRFGALGLRCRDCPVRCHPDCRYLLTMSCVPTNGTPTLKGGIVGYISEHAPNVPPMIPALIVHCVNEVETRGLNEVGIYRVSGSEREVKALKERFLRGKSGTPHLGTIDIHVLCGCIKDFLRSLREPLIPTGLWKDFCNAVQNPNEGEIPQELYKAIGALPQANRDTLAFLILHFQRIAECPDVLMPIENMARIFGPTIVGYSSMEPDQHAIFTEVYTQYQVMLHLLKIPTSYWTQFVAVALENNNNNNNNKDSEQGTLTRTPSHNKESLYSLYATPMKTTLKKRKFYNTPPYSSKK